jgi:hypothetical protein
MASRVDRPFESLGFGVGAERQLSEQDDREVLSATGEPTDQVLRRLHEAAQNVHLVDALGTLVDDNRVTSVPMHHAPKLMWERSGACPRKCRWVCALVTARSRDTKSGHGHR